MTENPTHTGERARRILIVRLSAHGDVIHTLPVLAAVRKKYPQAKIGWLVDSSAAPLLAGHTALDALHVWPRQPGLQVLWNPFRWPKLWRQVTAMRAELRAYDYEMSLDVQGFLKSAVWPFLVGIPQRFGFKDTRESADIFYNRKVAPISISDPNRFAADQFLDLARAIGCDVPVPEYAPLVASPQARQKMDQLLSDLNPEKPLVVLAPFTRWQSKHWIAEYWPPLMQDLLRMDAQLVILGAPGDVDSVNTMLANLPDTQDILSLAGKTEWTDLYALFERTRLMIGLDSGPLHIANAVGVPELIALYGPTMPGRTGPIGEQHTTLVTNLPCQPCLERECPIKTHDCMRQLTPEMVAEVARRHLMKSKANSPGTASA